MADVSIDAKGKKCPLPIVMISQEIRKMEVGKTVEVVSDDMAFEEDVKAFCRVSGNKLENIEKVDKVYIAIIRKV